MQKYEMLILLKSDMEEEAREAELKKYADIVTSLGGTVESTDKWGAKKTAYPIAFKQEAFYALMTFNGNGDVVKELDRVAGISGDLMRRMITKVKEN
ncbi:MAG: 30S ribosomal protein S6 [Clostridia bacterium]|jgi:small subunit ribosomal protein S6|nr:30S ribosomal protein S6 [Clostridia bacterium]